MSERREFLQAKLRETRSQLNTVLDQVGDRAETQVYSDGLAWTVRQVVAHLADAEKGHYNQLTNIAEGRDIIPPDFDIERYNKRVTEKTAEKTIEQSRADLEVIRAQLVDWLNTVDDEKLDRTGRHASLKIMSVHEILKLLYRHERLHTTDIANALGIQI